MKAVIISLNFILIILFFTCGCITMQSQNLSALSNSHNPEFTAVWSAALNETGIANATARIIDLGYIIEKDTNVKEFYFSFIGNNGQGDRWYFVSRDAYGKFSVEDRGKIDHPDPGPHPLAILRELDRLDLSQTPFKDANISISLNNGANIGFNNYSVPKIYKVENGVLSPISEIKFPQDQIVYYLMVSKIHNPMINITTESGSGAGQAVLCPACGQDSIIIFVREEFDKNIFVKY